MLNSRGHHKWLADNNSNTRILVMHHPLEWLSDWAKTELEIVIAEKFALVISGHNHQGVTTFSSRGIGGFVHCAAPQLFTKKSDLLGYEFVTFETSSSDIEVLYRQWTPSHKFVLGTAFADNDTGTKVFSAHNRENDVVHVSPFLSQPMNTQAILQAEFDEAITCYSSKKQIWVDRDLANLPETINEDEDVVMINPSDISENLRSCIIRAPKQYGLTCVGRFIALNHHNKSTEKTAVAMLDSTSIPAHRHGVITHITSRCTELHIERNALAGIILDNWHNDKSARRILREIQEEFPGTPVVILHSLDDCTEIANSIESEEVITYENYFLWALNRARIRELVVTYIDDLGSLDDNLVTKKLIEDIDALNIHRTPLNCLLILKLLEQAFDDSPVNRTEMIGRVLYLLFYQFDKIPRYATRPDLKDCEYALGFVCEWLIRSRKTSFSKNEFYNKVQEYCKTQILDLDSEVLFAFLATENILIRKGSAFEFRFSYWLYFFAAHRMHHDSAFADYILSESRYSAIPEIIEFYTGIDRRRSDAVSRLTEDLQRMNSEFLKRTGINESFNPYQLARWNPDEKTIENMERQVAESVAESTLPATIKDAMADKTYNRSKPYNQELAKFIEDSSLIQLVQTMKGAARALRNSDHVLPALKNELLNEVLRCWIRVCQILVILSPILAERRYASFEGMGFYLDKDFDKKKTDRERWEVIMSVVADNVVDWFQEDIFSKKMGALLSNYLNANQGSLGELMVLLVMAKQRPPGWEKEVEKFIIRAHKNSFSLSRIYAVLRHEFIASFSTERTRQQLRRLAAMSVSKHKTGSKHPNVKLVEFVAKQIDEDVPKTNCKESELGD